MKKVYIVSYARTAIGSFGGILSSLTATQLGSIAIEGALNKIEFDRSLIDEVIMGNVLSANLGQAPARQAALGAKLSSSVACTTVNKVCASGSKAIMFAAANIMTGMTDIAVAGGMESMSNVPFYLEKARTGYKLGHGQITDGLIKDGLWDVYNNIHMGSVAEYTAKTMNISREEQDAYTIESYRRAAEWIKKGVFATEIAPIQIAVKGKPTLVINEDEEYTKISLDKIPLLKPVFQTDGTITAANASSLNDGAAALVLMSEEKMKELNLTPLAEIISFADAAQEPIKFPTSPAFSVKKALKNAQISINEVDLFELNEAFAVVSIANNQLLNLNPEQVNIFGGAVSLGHPIGCSGARIVCTLLTALENTNKSIGVTGICNGGGGASSIVLRRC